MKEQTGRRGGGGKPSELLSWPSELLGLTAASDGYREAFLRASELKVVASLVVCVLSKTGLDTPVGFPRGGHLFFGVRGRFRGNPGKKSWIERSPELCCWYMG
jgi:hypothetical protein